MILKFRLKTKGGTTGVTCTTKGGTTGKFQKFQKVLETLPYVKESSKTIFLLKHLV